MSENFDYTMHTTDEVKKYRLHDGYVRVEILKGASQTHAAQALWQLAETVEKTSPSEWNKWDQSAE